METDLWTQYNLAERNPDVGGGIAYCLRYNSESLSIKRDYVIDALKSLTLDIEEHGEGLAVSFPKDASCSETQRVVLLLEELSVLNDALDYARVGLDQYSSVSELCNGIKINYFDSLSSDIVQAYNLVDMFVPAIVRELRIADMQNGILSSKDKESLDGLVAFAQNHVKLHNHPGGFTVLGYN